jgi:hypothetical protein
MATSGVSSFNATRDQIILASLRKLQAISATETSVNPTLITNCAFQLNALVKSLNATGLHIWTEEEATVFLQPSQISYRLGGTTTDNATGAYTATTLASSAASGATSISVTSAIGFGSGFFVGVVLNNGTIGWSTQSGAASGSTITLNTGLTGSAAGGTPVYVYQTQIVRPLRVVGVRRYNFASAIDTQMQPMLSRLDYRNLPNKTATGVPTQSFYDPRGGANSQGILNIWPAPADVTNAVKMTWWRPIQDFTTPGNNPDLPDEWIDALVWNLAYKLWPEFPISQALMEAIKEQAMISLENVSGWDREIESYYFGFDADMTQA